jgi:class 3 adenylate cyclase
VSIFVMVASEAHRTAPRQGGARIGSAPRLELGRATSPGVGVGCAQGSPEIPLFIDIHDIAGATLEQIADAHVKDQAVEGDFGVTYLKYWLNEARGKVFCLCTAPNAEAAQQVHSHAHGLLAERIIEVDPDLAEEMLGGGTVAPTGAVVLDTGGRLDPGMRTILFTDIVGSTELTQRLGDRAAMDVVDLHDRFVRGALGRTRGREVKHLGDGLMGVFVAADDAIRCASDVHAALRDAAGRTVEPVRVRVGVASGEPLERNGDFFGSTVQLAARLCGHAEPGQTLVSSSVVELCDGRRFSDLGEIMLKGFPQPVRAHAVVEA